MGKRLTSRLEIMHSGAGSLFLSRLENFEKMDGWLYKTADHLIKRANVKAAWEKKKVESIDAYESRPIPAAMIYEECYDLLESTQVDMGKCLKEVFESLTETENHRPDP